MIVSKIVNYSVYVKVISKRGLACFSCSILILYYYFKIDNHDISKLYYIRLMFNGTHIKKSNMHKLIFHENMSLFK